MILSHQDSSTGLFDPQLYVHAYAIWPSRPRTSPFPNRRWSAGSHQAKNGGWAFDGSDDPAQTDSNTTAVAIEALGQRPKRSDAISKALSICRACATTTDCTPTSPPSGVPLLGDANSTALVIQALLASGQLSTRRQSRRRSPGWKHCETATPARLLSLRHAGRQPTGDSSGAPRARR